MSTKETFREYEALSVKEQYGQILRMCALKRADLAVYCHMYNIPLSIAVIDIQELQPPGKIQEIGRAIEQIQIDTLGRFTRAQAAQHFFTFNLSEPTNRDYRSRFDKTKREINNVEKGGKKDKGKKIGRRKSPAYLVY